MAYTSKYTGQLIDNMFESMYPVGAIYISMVNSSPAGKYGGTWTAIKDKFLLSASDSFTAGNTGGEATHTLTVDEMPYHCHEGRIDTIRRQTYSTGYYYSTSMYDGGTCDLPYTCSIGNTTYTGGSQSHNNMPPYLTVYI